MSRDLTPSVLSAIQGAVVKPILLFEGEFTSGFVRLWTGYGTIDWNGQTWVGGGDLIEVSAMQETSQFAATGVKVSLSGVKQSLVSAAIQEAQQNLPGSVYLGFLDENGAIYADPANVFYGTIDVPEIIDSADTCRISISYETDAIERNVPRKRKYTDEDQKTDYPNDRGLEYVAVIQDQEIRWGR